MKSLGNLPIGIGFFVTVMAFIIFLVGLMDESTPWGDATQAAATLLAGIVAASLIGWQIFETRKEQQNKLKIEIYQSLTPKIDRASDQLIKLKSTASRYLKELAVFEAPGGNKIPNVTYEALKSAHGDYSTAFSEITVAIEDWGFIDKRVELFRVALACAKNDVEDAWQEYLETVWPYLQMTPIVQGKPLLTFTPPPIAVQEKVRHFEGVVHSTCFTLVGYLLDFRTEMQKLLLGSLFPEGHHDTREPRDDNAIFLRIDQHEEQLQHFYTNHPFGKKMFSEKKAL